MKLDAHNRKRLFCVFFLFVQRDHRIVWYVLDMPYVQLPASHQNVKLYYEVHGSGDIKVLFIMGLRTEGCAWRYQVKLECAFKKTCFDIFAHID